MNGQLNWEERTDAVDRHGRTPRMLKAHFTRKPSFSLRTWFPRAKLPFWLGFLASLLLVEAGYRAALFHKYAVVAAFPVTVVDTTPSHTWLGTPNNVHGKFDPGVTTYSNFDIKGKLYSRNRITANNMGWVSHFDYNVTKKPGEYRVAVIGDSFVASVTNEMPWTDVLQSLLMVDSDVKEETKATEVTVMSFGVAGAPVSMIGDELFDIAKRYDADLIIFNIIPATLDRPFPPITPAGSRDFSVKPGAPKPAPPPDFEIDGIEFVLFCFPPRTLANPDCQVSPVWLARGDPSIGEAKVQNTKKQLARKMMWERVITSPYSLIALEFMGNPLIKRAEAAPKQAEKTVTTTDAYAPEVIQMLQAFDTLRNIHANMMFTSALTYQQMLDQDPTRLERLRQLVAAGTERGIHVLDMREYLPRGTAPAELKTWYQVPNDGHFSEKGAEIYAEAMHAAIRQHLGLAD